ncbi:TFIIH basal transcription factor complex, subunit SSL1 [Aureobasidium sp. EXF-10727]|nr:TFIIH basal transcription factor complex, subunit SSL1 [Aureobasidium sp. EXF-10727]
MAHHDMDYDMDMSDDANEDLNTRSSRSTHPSRTQDPGKAKVSTTTSSNSRAQRWEAGAQKNWDLHEGSDGNLTSVLGGMEEATKRLRLQKDTTPLQRGIIRHCLLVLDLSAAMLEKDLRPTRFLLTLTYTMAFVREFFEQNPISQLGILGMRDGLAVRISELSGNPNDHIQALKELRSTEPKGAASLQNALEMARAALYHTPSHGTREVVIILGALSSSDPGDIHSTINACVRDKLRVTVIGLAAQMHICADLCARTNAGDQSSYNVALDEPHYRELLMQITTPPVMRSSSSSTATAASALLQMGFPSRYTEPVATLCACHGVLTQGGYNCSRCNAKVCSLPQTCPACDLTLILSTHLARSYHHLFPLLLWNEVSWARATQKNSSRCFGCLNPFPAPPKASAEAGVNGEQQQQQRAQGASESSRYECPSCERHFCVDCDVFCHEVVHNCPGCTSGAAAATIQENGNGVADVVMNGNGIAVA